MPDLTDDPGAVAAYDQTRMEAIRLVRKASAFVVLVHTPLPDGITFDQRLVFGYHGNTETLPAIMLMLLTGHWRELRERLGVGNDALLEMVERTEAAAS